MKENWQIELFKKYIHLNFQAEDYPQAQKLVMYLPKMPEMKTIEDLKSLIPYKDVQIIEDMKPEAKRALEEIAWINGVTYDLIPIGRHATIYIDGQAKDSSSLIEQMSKVILMDGYYNDLFFGIGGEVISCNIGVLRATKTSTTNNSIPMDETDIKIALEMSKDVNDFLALIEGRKPRRTP